MKGNWPYTKPKLNRALLDLLKHPEVHLTFATIRGDFVGEAKWENLFPPTNVQIRIDANGDDHIQTTIHELIHVIIEPMCIGYLDETLEEAVVVGLDQLMTEYVKKSPKRLKEWNDAIRAKLDEGKKPLAMEELSDR